MKRKMNYRLHEITNIVHLIKFKSGSCTYEIEILELAIEHKDVNRVFVQRDSEIHKEHWYEKHICSYVSCLISSINIENFNA